MLLGWVKEGKHFGVVEGGLELSNGTGARVKFDAPHPDLFAQHPELREIPIHIVVLQHPEILAWNLAAAHLEFEKPIGDSD